ncbi:MAG: hypothetical protein PHQ33_07370 [Bacteroidales bacterium]|nr:hypothetical protein [Bacteroidales bacterium]
MGHAKTTGQLVVAFFVVTGKLWNLIVRVINSDFMFKIAEVGGNP